MEFTVRNLSSTIPIDFTVFPIENANPITSTPDVYRERPHSKTISLMPTGGVSVRKLRYSISMAEFMQYYDSVSPLPQLVAQRYPTGSTTTGLPNL
jgi:hypothetical protein